MEKAIQIGWYIVETRNTIRTTAKEFEISPSTVGRYIHKVLPGLNLQLANQVRVIIDYHKSIAYLRGGEGNKIRHKKLRVEKKLKLLEESR